MLLIFLALFWVALLTPIAIRHFRDGGTEKSIESFHAEHEVLSRQDYSVAPAHRLDQADEEEPDVSYAERRPRLTVVHADDTFGTLESRSSWDEWAEDYDYESSERLSEPRTNRYARAYASRPSAPVVTPHYEAPIRRRSMRSQRRMMFSRLVVAALVLTVLAIVMNSSIVVDVAALSWFSVVLFVALAFYAVSQGYLHESSLPRMPRVPRVALPVSRSRRRPLAAVAPLYATEDRAPTQYFDDYEFEPEYETAAEDEWRREPLRRHALG